VKTTAFTENTLRRLGPAALATILSFLSLGLAFLELAAVAQTAKPKLVLTARPTTLPKAPEPSPVTVAPPGSALYVAKRGDSIPLVARHYLGQTSYLTSAELTEAIHKANGDLHSTFLKAGQPVIVPGLLPAPIVEKSVPVERNFEVRAVYLTGIMAASDHGIRIIKHWREVGGNAVVFDIKDSDGTVTIAFDHPLLGAHHSSFHDLPKFIHFLHSQNMHAIARIAMFRDQRLVETHPELAVKSHRTGQTWRENGKLVWTDPSQPKVQEYDIALAKKAAQAGADEIQFDYVRFPAEGDQKDAAFVYQNSQPEAAQAAEADADNNSCGDRRLGRPGEAKQGGTSTAADAAETQSAPAPKGRKNAAHGATPGTAATGANQASEGRQTKGACKVAAKAGPRGPQRTDVITAFLKKAYAELHPTGVLLSLDVFGVMAWQRQVDLSHTGQDIVGMAHYCDVLSPMIYPSHFFGMDNIAHPGDEPAHFIGESMDRFELITKGSGVVIRPWLQAFHWRTKTYSPEYIKVQVETAKDKGGIGFLFWNAANDYSKPYEAMPEMKAADLKQGSKDKSRYFRGDELPITTTQAALTPTK
jgi:hypothetical protein